MESYRYIGSHADSLEGGRPVEPGEFTGAIDVSPDSPKNHQLLEDGLLIEAAAPPAPEPTKKGSDK